MLTYRQRESLLKTQLVLLLLIFWVLLYLLMRQAWTGLAYCSVPKQTPLSQLFLSIRTILQGSFLQSLIQSSFDALLLVSEYFSSAFLKALTYFNLGYFLPYSYYITPFSANWHLRSIMPMPPDLFIGKRLVGSKRYWEQGSLVEQSQGEEGCQDWSYERRLVMCCWRRVLLGWV